jgi:hypothetical protein
MTSASARRAVDGDVAALALAGLVAAGRAGFTAVRAAGSFTALSMTFLAAVFMDSSGGSRRSLLEKLRAAPPLLVGGVIFGDGIEEVRREFGWGSRATLGLAAEQLRPVKKGRCDLVSLH